MKFNLRNNGEVRYTISEANEKVTENYVLKNLQAIENTYSKRNKSIINGSVYYITIATTIEKATQKIILEP